MQIDINVDLCKSGQSTQTFNLVRKVQGFKSLSQYNVEVVLHGKKKVPADNLKNVDGIWAWRRP